MRKTILFGSLIACFLMLMVPNVSAIEYQTVEDAFETQLLEKIQYINYDDLREQIKEINSKDVLETITEKLVDDNPQPGIIITLLFIVIAIIATILATISAGIMLLVLNLLQIVYQVLGTIISTIGKIIMWIIDLIIP